VAKSLKIHHLPPNSFTEYSYYQYDTKLYFRTS